MLPKPAAATGHVAAPHGEGVLRARRDPHYRRGTSPAGCNAAFRIVALLHWGDAWWDRGEGRGTRRARKGRRCVCSTHGHSSLIGVNQIMRWNARPRAHHPDLCRAPRGPAVQQGTVCNGAGLWGSSLPLRALARSAWRRCLVWRRCSRGCRENCSERNTIGRYRRVSLICGPRCGRDPPRGPRWRRDSRDRPEGCRSR